jgi:subtilisin family serine protease
MMPQRIWPRVLLPGLLGLLIIRPSGGATVVPAGPQFGAPAPSARLRVFGAAAAPATRPPGADRLDGALAEIAQRYPGISVDHPLADLRAINPAARFRISAPLATPEVLIDAVTTGDAQALKRALLDLGLRDVAVYSNDVGGWLPLDQIGRAASLSGLRYARASMPRTRAGPVATQGDFVQGSAAIRASYPSLTGAGITVGVLSDSFNCYQTYATDGVPASGFNGYASNGFTATYATDQMTGALPAGVSVLEEATCMDYGQPEQLPFGDEGRALLQIVHAVAPGASLAFHTGASSEADFANGIVALANAGAKIIDDDIGYPDEPFFQDGVVAQAIDQVAATGVAYFSSAGNDARVSYENAAPMFPVASPSGPNAGQLLLNFDTSGATTTTSLPVTIPALYPGEFVSLIVEWDQPYVTGAPDSGGATSSIDVCLSGTAGGDQIDFQNVTTAVACTGPNATGVDPVQYLIIGNSAAATASTAAETLNISIGLANAHAPGLIKLALEGDGAAVSINAFATNSPTIQGHPNAAGAMAVGAAFYFRTPQCATTPAVLESFSSAGGDPILFGPTGTRLASPQMRQKPDFVGPDGVNDTFLGFSLQQYGLASNTLNTTIAACQNDASYPNFFGTSAAGPHAAAAAALMWQANPALTAAQIDTALESSALAMGAVPNTDSGYGFIQADAALALLPPGPPTITLSPTAVTVGGSATLSWSSVSTSSCSASGSWSGSEPTSGSQTVTPASAGSYTYTLTCSGPGGGNSNSAVLTAKAASGGGGGGGLDELSLLALCGALLLRRQPPS